MVIYHSGRVNKTSIRCGAIRKWFNRAPNVDGAARYDDDNVDAAQRLIAISDYNPGLASWPPYFCIVVVVAFVAESL